jgi:hypothetical protein
VALGVAIVLGFFVFPLLAMAAQVWSRWRDSRGIAAVGIFFGNLLAIRLLGLLAEWLDKS